MDDKENRFVNDLLDASLRKYAGAEPRPGLEGRILAGVRSRQQQARRRTAWLSAFAVSGVAAVVVGMAGFAAFRGDLRHPAPEPAIANHQASKSAATVATAVPPVKLPAPLRVTRQSKSTMVDWRPQQFPTPRPLSEQEKLLLAYVQALQASHSVTEQSGVASQPDVASENAQQDATTDLVIPPLSITPINIKPLDTDEDGAGK